MKKKKVWLIVVGVILILLVGAGGMYFAITKFDLFSQTIINKSEKEVTVTDTGIADAVEKLYDAVVVVDAYQSGTLTSSGTGFVYKTDGDTAYILTNNHVVDGATSVKVQFTNGKTYDVKLVGKDEYSDIAVLSIDKDNIISVASIGSSADARLGDTVFTIGAPIGSEYSWTVTRGIVSGKDRLVEVSDSSTSTTSSTSTSTWVMSVLQTDAAINSGNSGGPLANSNGEVIGITNMKLVDDSIEGMGFAIPIDDAVEYAELLIKNGSITRPLLGVGTLDVSDSTSLMYQYGISIDSSITSGAVVGYVQSGSPADDAGLKQGDVITKLGDYEIDDSAHLRYYLYKFNVGDSVKVTYIRGTTTKTATIKLDQASS